MLRIGTSTLVHHGAILYYVMVQGFQFAHGVFFYTPWYASEQGKEEAIIPNSRAVLYVLPRLLDINCVMGLNKHDHLRGLRFIPEANLEINSRGALLPSGTVTKNCHEYTKDLRLK